MKIFTPDAPRRKGTTIYFGDRLYDTYLDFDSLCKRRRESKPQCIKYLLEYLHENERRRSQPIV